MIGYDGRPAQIEVRYDAIDPVLLGKMESIGLSPVAVQDAIRNGEYNEFTTTYFLLKKKYEREQLVSILLLPFFTGRIVAWSWTNTKYKLNSWRPAPVQLLMLLLPLPLLPLMQATKERALKRQTPKSCATNQTSALYCRGLCVGGAYIYFRQSMLFFRVFFSLFCGCC
jgi:hypothetical protein